MEYGMWHQAIARMKRYEMKRMERRKKKKKKTNPSDTFSKNVSFDMKERLKRIT